MRWQEFQSRFDFTWECCNGSGNVADPISHCSTVMCTLMSMLAEWAPAGDESVPGGLLRQIVNVMLVMNGLQMRETLLHCLSVMASGADAVRL